MRRVGLLNLCLDVLEPFGPFAAQFLYVLQPTLGLVLDRDRIGAWAHRLETPEGLESLRREWLGETDVRH